MIWLNRNEKLKLKMDCRTVQVLNEFVGYYVGIFWFTKNLILYSNTYCIGHQLVKSWEPLVYCIYDILFTLQPNIVFPGRKPSKQYNINNNVVVYQVACIAYTHIIMKVERIVKKKKPTTKYTIAPAAPLIEYWPSS